jgi:hypothetical protein
MFFFVAGAWRMRRALLCPGLQKKLVIFVATSMMIV